jgi:alpha,alpha-trehalose-phosphate synthase [UDP-forming]
MSSRLIVVSNRLPVTFRPQNTGYQLDHGSGGLVSALEPVMNKMGGCWIGWPGAELTPDASHSLEASMQFPYRLIPVSLSKQDIYEYYNGCSNTILWPLFHGFPSECRFDPNFWDAYQNVNERFAEAVRSVATPRDFVWVHDYHLMTVATALSDRECRLKLGYFHHIPFPDPDTFGKLPWRTEILQGLLNYNVVGFQTTRDRQHFIAALKRYLPGQIGLRRIGNSNLITASGIRTVVGAFPVSIDFKRFSEVQYTDNRRVTELRTQLPGQPILFGLDRLDYTKGILERLSAYEALLMRHPEFIGKVHFVQVVIPSRQDIASYSGLRNEIERKVSNINGQFAGVGWLPITYLYRSLSHEDLVAFYRAADVAVITPLRDGMNLVAKEFCASRNDERGVLVLSEFAGAAEELKDGALLANPYDVAQLSEAMKRALTMPASEAMERMRVMRDQVRRNDVWRWSSSFCSTRAFTTPTPEPIQVARYAFAAASEAAN